MGRVPNVAQIERQLFRLAIICVHHWHHRLECQRAQRVAIFDHDIRIGNQFPSDGFSDKGKIGNKDV
ncbi:hypothetical protein BMW22_38730 (plasmid) [Rhizobium leguminosarum]|uniref:Uncharacterized protein n=1 Tax=Rhizobium leguminosarum TaxID=384 RepID=A0A1L3ZP85_RHILE|nr:hypothetical protein BMW22_38730 [Rhizobium leguminosarum]